MPSPYIIWEAWIFPVTIIKEQPSISPRMNHVLTGSPTSARLILPISLTLLKYYPPPSVKSQGALWQRHTVCLSNTGSESEMSCQSPTKAAPPLCVPGSQENTRSKTHESRLGIRWPCWVSAPNPCRHLRLCLSLSCPQCHLTHVTYPEPIRGQPWGEPTCQSSSSSSSFHLTPERAGWVPPNTFSVSALGQGRATSCLLPRSSKPQHSMVPPPDQATSTQSYVRALLSSVLIQVRQGWPPGEGCQHHSLSTGWWWCKFRAASYFFTSLKSCPQGSNPSPKMRHYPW